MSYLAALLADDDAAPITATYSVYISNQPVSVLASGTARTGGGPLSIDTAIGRVSTASFSVQTDTNTHYQQYQHVEIYDQNSQLAFSGYISTPVEQKPGFQNVLEQHIVCMGQEWLAKKRVVAASYTNKTCGYIAQDIYNNILKQEGITVGAIYDGLTPGPNLYPSPTLYPGGNVGLIPQANFNYCTVAQALDELVKAASSSGVPYYWAIDMNKQLWFVPYTWVAGPTVDGTQIDDGLQRGSFPTVTWANPLDRTQQYVTGGTTQTTAQTETRQGDGKTRAFTFSYPLAQAPSAFTINGASKTLGIKGTTGSQYYWAQGDPVISQDSGQTILVSTDTMSMTYVGQYPNTAFDQNAARVQYVASLSGDSGIIEAVQNDPSQTSAANALSECSQLLTRYGQQAAQLVFATRQSGFAPGQLCSVNLPMFGLNNAQMLVENVHADDQIDGFNIWYTITAVLGPYDVGWVNFFSSLLAQAQTANTINVGVSQSTQLLGTGTIVLSPVLTGTGTVYACPIPSTTLYPATNLYPC